MKEQGLIYDGKPGQDWMQTANLHIQNPKYMQIIIHYKRKRYEQNTDAVWKAFLWILSSETFLVQTKTIIHRS